MAGDLKFFVATIGTSGKVVRDEANSRKNEVGICEWKGLEGKKANHASHG
jgi:hypothetical protein